MVSACSAINCTVRYTAKNKALGITFHKFPKDVMKRKVWALATRREGVKSGSAWNPPKSAKLCSKHFLEKDFEVAQATKRLRENVVPSVFDFGPVIKSKVPIQSKGPIIIHTRSCKDAAEPPANNLPDPTTQNNENENTTESPTSNLPGPSYAVQEDEVQFLKRKLETTEFKYKEVYKKFHLAQKEISEQNEMIRELLNDLVSLKKDGVKLLKRKLEKTEAKYEEVCKSLCIAQKEVSEQNRLIRELVNELASLKKDDESD